MSETSSSVLRIKRMDQSTYRITIAGSGVVNIDADVPVTNMDMSIEGMTFSLAANKIEFREVKEGQIGKIRKGSANHVYVVLLPKFWSVCHG